jgi:predicted O-methyltransferase YrrM
VSKVETVQQSFFKKEIINVLVTLMMMNSSTLIYGIVISLLFLQVVYCEGVQEEKSATWPYHYPYTVNEIEKQVFAKISQLQSRFEKKKITYDGHIGIFPAEILQYVSFASHESIKNVVEIGFNAGHSAMTLLASNHKIKLTTFTYQAVTEGVEFVKKYYSSRFEVVFGPSQSTVKKWLPTVPKGYIDLMIIDGNHTYPAPREDFMMLLSRAHIGTRYIFDGAYKDCSDVVEAGWAIEVIHGKTSNYFLTGQDEISIGHRPGMIPNELGTHGSRTGWCMGVIIKLPDNE